MLILEMLQNDRTKTYYSTFIITFVTRYICEIFTSNKNLLSGRKVCFLHMRVFWSPLDKAKQFSFFNRSDTFT